MPRFAWQVLLPSEATTLKALGSLAGPLRFAPPLLGIKRAVEKSANVGGGLFGHFFMRQMARLWV